MSMDAIKELKKIKEKLKKENIDVSNTISRLIFSLSPRLFTRWNSYYWIDDKGEIHNYKSNNDWKFINKKNIWIPVKSITKNTVRVHIGNHYIRWSNKTIESKKYNTQPEFYQNIRWKKSMEFIETTNTIYEMYFSIDSETRVLAQTLLNIKYEQEGARNSKDIREQLL